MVSRICASGSVKNKHQRRVVSKEWIVSEFSVLSKCCWASILNFCSMITVTGTKPRLLRDNRDKSKNFALHVVRV